MRYRRQVNDEKTPRGPRVNVQVNLSKQGYDELVKLAEATQRSRSATACDLLEEYLLAR